MGLRKRQNWLCTLLMVLIVALQNVVLPLEEEEEEPLYLYDEDAGVVIEYIPTIDTPNPRRPDFLYSPNNGPRLVEFYAPWCPHCQSFRDPFVEFAGEITKLAEIYGEDNLKVHSISCEAHLQLCRDWAIKGFPQLRIFKAGATNYTARVLYRKLNAHAVLTGLGIKPKNAAAAFAEEKAIRKNDDADTAGHKNLRVSERDKVAARLAIEKVAKMQEALAYNRTKSDISNDAFLSFHFALRNGIFMTNEGLSTKARNNLWQWIDLLYKTIPPTNRIHSLARAIREDFDFAVTGEEHMLKIVEAYPPFSKKWTLACTKGRKAAGYTCGLWELFHMVTVGVVEWNKLITDGNWKMKIGVEDAALTIRNYVENFFGCEVCRMHFMAAFDSCAHNRCYRLNNKAKTNDEWIELPMWLFETHNSVNVRLMKERADMKHSNYTVEDITNARWPSRDHCPDCWQEDGAWSEAAVIEKMIHDYWPKDTSFLLTVRRDLFNGYVSGDDDEEEYEEDDDVGAKEVEEENVLRELAKEDGDVESMEKDIFGDAEKETEGHTDNRDDQEANHSEEGVLDAALPRVTYYLVPFATFAVLLAWVAQKIRRHNAPLQKDD